MSGVGRPRRRPPPVPAHRSSVIDSDNRAARPTATAPPSATNEHRRRPRTRTMLGWREWVSFPQHGVPWLKAKVDTGARTSSIHARDPQRFQRDGEPWVRFLLEPWQQSNADPVEIEAPLHDQRWVRSSSGERDHRPVILMPVTIAGVTHDVELTLSERSDMGFRMLLGRQALRGYYQVDPGRSYLGGRPPKEIRRRNRGRSPQSTLDQAETP